MGVGVGEPGAIVGVGVGVGTRGDGDGDGPKQFSVRIKSSQPPEMLPESPPASSITYRLQVPFGFAPLKVDRATLPEGTGAGAENVSPVPTLFGP